MTPAIGGYAHLLVGNLSMQNAFWIRRAARTWVAAKTPRLLATTAVALIGLLGTGVHAQDANNGKALYNTPLVAGERSCSNGACHGPDPLDRHGTKLLQRAGQVASSGTHDSAGREQLQLL